MLTLYVKTGCPFCNRVLAVGKELGLTFDEKNVADPAVTAELIARGGKKQEPYLIDAERGVEMYESPAIESYLREHYGGGAAAPAPIHVSQDVCIPKFEA